ncbi:putative O-methyltransferase YrrM [Saccharopolyspora lacisalsi]|uniref:Putative O-methyltransferase YrrM n=1 Tax=Halosaccharopolyspora lacisalsi TaxID=1000566 RepID=A0A839DQD1_9PSEU|nr:class I SAM-dependent methyltransferase [Halosaccharopolyspora lacisalsi]MBA8822949.1 putative O-methyltransferase YrrM [Halosaccharopolyspora lacisalsi]
MAPDVADKSPAPESLPATTEAALRYLTSVLRARAVVEVGTGSGATSLALLEGMHPDGVLTSIDIDPEAQRLARAAFAEAGVPAKRTRLITGLAPQVLPRLAEGAYDLVFVDAAKREYPRYLELGVELLRLGGTMVFTGVLADEPHDPARRDVDNLALQELVRAVDEDERLLPAVFPVGAGLLALARV